MATRQSVANKTMIQKAALAFGVIFAIVTVAGFVPGLTTDYDRLGTFGDEGAKLLGIFGVNWLENVVHLLFAVAGFVAAATFVRARQYFLFGGALYAVVALYGIVTGTHSDANLIGVNAAGNGLHALLAVTMIAIGLTLGRDEAARA